MKRMKKVLSIVLSLAMILTSITIYDAKTTKADDVSIAEIQFTDQTKLVKENTQIDAYWSKVEGSVKDMVYIYDAETAKNITSESSFELNDSAVSSNIDWCWNNQGGADGQKADLICRNYGKTLYTKDGGNFTIVVVSYDKNDKVIAFGKKTLTTIKYSTSIINTKLNLSGENCTELGTEKPIFKWSSVAGAEKYVLTATDDVTGNTLKTWEITDNITKELSFDAKEVQDGKDGTYTMKIEAYDGDGKLIEADKGDVISVSKCKKFYSTNKNLNFRSNGKEATVLENDGPTLNWDTVDGAESYTIVATDDGTKKELRKWTFGKNVTQHYFWNSDVQDGNDGTYTLTITAYDVNSNAIEPQEGDTYQIKNCAKYYKKPVSEDPDLTETGVEQTGYTESKDIDDWKKLDGRTNDGATAWISEKIYNDSMGAKECNGLLPADNSLAGKVKYNISTNLEKADVFAFVAKGGNPTAVVINGTRYLNAQANTLVYIGNDCVYINQSLLTIPEGQDHFDYIITAEGSSETPTFVLQLRADERCKVSINGENVEKVATNGTYTLPSSDNVKYYYSNGNFYKPGTTVTITEDMNFVTVSELSVNLTNGAAIRIDANEEAGIRFKADINVKCGVDTVKDDIINAVQAGILISTQDKLDNASIETLDMGSIGKATVLNVENKGWFDNEVGSYCASLINIVAADYPRTFVARAYVKVTYSDGNIDYLYSEEDKENNYSQSVSRTVEYIAKQILADESEMKLYTEEEKTLINKFAGNGTVE